MKTFAMKLREERDKRALKQIELAELLGVSMRMIGDYENDRRRPHRKKLKQFAEILELPYGYLADDRYETVAAFFNGTMDDTPAEEKYLPMLENADTPLSVPKTEGVSPRAEQEMSFIQAHAHVLFAGADLPQEAKDRFFESLYDSYLMCRAKAQASGMDVDKMTETGAMNGNSTWLFTEYNGQCGWINTLGANGKMVIYFEEATKKPVIYLYPEQETDVHVELELTESELNTTYPKYDNGWDVAAYPDGMLLNKADGSHHKYLFWDAVNCRTRFDFSKGFCVAGSDTESFLKEKLTYMGLNEQEMNEFIVYWLPLMEHNAYNLISFQGDVYTNSAKLKITPTPDSECRVFMAYVPLENAVAIEPQQLETFERNGFTVVEWGGAEVNTFNLK